MRRTTIVLVFAAVAAAAGCSDRQRSEPSGLASSVREIVESGAAADDTSGVRTADGVREFYETRSYRPAWIQEDDPPERLRSAVRLLCGAAGHGLNPRDYIDVELERAIELAYGVEPDEDSLRVQRLAALDAAVTRRLMEFTEDLSSGRVDPGAFGEMRKASPAEIEPWALLSEAAAQSEPELITKRLGRTHSEYTSLVGALNHYRAVLEDGGFPEVERGPTLAVGDSGARVVSVRQRLAASADLDSTAAADPSRIYDAALRSAVHSFQERHGLEVDGEVDGDEIDAMNVPVETRIRQIELNLERWRWMPRSMGERYLSVNIPAFQLRGIDGGEEVLVSDVIVGDEYDARSTPVFNDTMEYVVFNPYWNIPESISRGEILPRAREDSTYLSQNDYEIVTAWETDAEVVPPTSRNLDLLEEGEYQLRQKPGPQNALGRIKFMFPNRFDIYLHDTPADYLFDRRDRSYSHGCIRVEQELDLAEFVLTGWPRDRIEKAIADNDRRTEHLENPVPVYLMYRTSFVDDEGRVHFRDDIYGHDEALGSALAERAAERPPASCTSLLSNPALR